MFDRGVEAMREGDFKIVRPKKEANVSLFHLAKDIAEKQDIAGADGARVRAMQEAYEEWNAQLVAPAFPGLEMKEWKPK